MPIKKIDFMETRSKTAKAFRYALLFLAIIIIIPMDVVVAFGMTFTANFSATNAVFLVVACLTDIPAVAISFSKPRLGSLIILAGAVSSVVIAAAFFLSHGEFPTEKVAGQALFFLVPKMLVGAGLYVGAVKSNLYKVIQKNSE